VTVPCHPGGRQAGAEEPREVSCEPHRAAAAAASLLLVLLLVSPAAQAARLPVRRWVRLTVTAPQCAVTPAAPSRPRGGGHWQPSGGRAIPMLRLKARAPPLSGSVFRRLRGLNRDSTASGRARAAGIPSIDTRHSSVITMPVGRCCGRRDSEPQRDRDAASRRVCTRAAGPASDTGRGRASGTGPCGPPGESGSGLRLRFESAHRRGGLWLGV
jgi:hypothetical protein